MKQILSRVGATRRPGPRTIHYVIDEPGWVQARRLEQFRRHLPQYRFRMITAGQFERRWERNRLRGEPVYLASWRSTHALWKARPELFSPRDCQAMMAGVTSHTNIGGGLDPLQPIGDRSPEEALRLAVDFLSRCRVVIANSRILQELLSARLPDLLYCPNGVDADFYTPPSSSSYDPRRIRIGWVGKIRGPKNVATIEAACEKLREEGFVTELIGVPKGTARTALLSELDMREFYRRIDFYLCASWNEGTPNPALEAAACGVPIVTTCVGNMRELIRHGVNGFLIDPTVDSIVTTFRSVSNLDSESFHRMSKSVRETILSEWTWEKNMRNYVPAFRRLLDISASSARPGV